MPGWIYGAISDVIGVNRWLAAHLPVVKLMLFVLCLAPLAWLLLGAFGMAGIRLGANPVEAIIHHLGLWGLRFLLLTLTVTPLRTLSRLPALTRLRRMLGLFAFFYVLLHFLSYAIIDQGLLLAAIIEDILKRPYITLGITGLLLLIPLALTSTNAMRRRLGRRWQKLHQLIYLIATLGVWHFYWQVKQDILEPLIYAGILALLLGVRWYLQRVSIAARRPARV